MATVCQLVRQFFDQIICNCLQFVCQLFVNWPVRCFTNSLLIAYNSCVDCVSSGLPIVCKFNWIAQFPPNTCDLFVICVCQRLVNCFLQLFVLKLVLIGFPIDLSIGLINCDLVRICASTVVQSKCELPDVLISNCLQFRCQLFLSCSVNCLIHLLLIVYTLCFNHLVISLYSV